MKITNTVVRASLHRYNRRFLSSFVSAFLCSARISAQILAQASSSRVLESREIMRDVLLLRIISAQICPNVHLTVIPIGVNESRCDFFIMWVLQPVKIISLILSRVNRKVGWKWEIPEKNHLTPHPNASRTWFVSHMTRARLEPTAVRWRAI